MDFLRPFAIFSFFFLFFCFLVGKWKGDFINETMEGREGKEGVSSVKEEIEWFCNA